MRTIKHYRRIANFNTLLCSVIGAMIKVQSYRNSDAHGIDQIVYHVNYLAAPSDVWIMTGV